MDVKPLTRYTDPGYPTHAVLDAQPELLRLTPKRWQRTAALLTGMAAACLLTSGCPQGYYVNTACLSVAPPTYMTEEEVRQVVVDEARRAHLRFRTDVPLTRNIELRYPAQSGGEMVDRLTVTLDGVDTRRRVAYLYLDDETLTRMRATSYHVSSLSTTPAGVDQLVSELQQAITASGQGPCGVFHESDSYEYATEDDERGAIRRQVRDFVDWLRGQGAL